MSKNTEGLFDFQSYLQSDEISELRDFTKITDIFFSVSGSISAIVG